MAVGYFAVAARIGLDDASSRVHLAREGEKIEPRDTAVWATRERDVVHIEVTHTDHTESAMRRTGWTRGTKYWT